MIALHALLDSSRLVDCAWLGSARLTTVTNAFPVPQTSARRAPPPHTKRPTICALPALNWTQNAPNAPIKILARSVTTGKFQTGQSVQAVRRASLLTLGNAKGAQAKFKIVPHAPPQTRALHATKAMPRPAAHSVLYAQTISM